MPDGSSHAVGDNVPRWPRSSKPATLDIFTLLNTDPMQLGDLFES